MGRLQIIIDFVDRAQPFRGKERTAVIFVARPDAVSGRKIFILLKMIKIPF